MQTGFALYFIESMERSSISRS